MDSLQVLRHPSGSFQKWTLTYKGAVVIRTPTKRTPNLWKQPFTSSVLRRSCCARYLIGAACGAPTSAVPLQQSQAGPPATLEETVGTLMIPTTEGRPDDIKRLLHVNRSRDPPWKTTGRATSQLQKTSSLWLARIPWLHLEQTRNFQFGSVELKIS